MIQIRNVVANVVSTKREVVYCGILVGYFDGEVRGHVNLDLPESVAMNLTLNDIRERVVLKLRGVQ